jgi:hypothetical protein
MGPRPERSEGCLAIARQTEEGDFFETAPSFPSYTWIAIIKHRGVVKMNLVELVTVI